MTTVVFDGSMLAADTRGTRSIVGGTTCPSCKDELENVHSQCKKIWLGRADTMFRGERVIAWGGSGAEPAMVGVSTAIQENLDLDKVIKVSYRINGGHENHNHLTCTILLVTETKAYILTVGKMTVKIVEQTKFPVSIGSGKSVATFAMRYFDLTAFGGVAAAMRSDNGTGGDIDYVLCREGKGRSTIVNEKFSEAEFEELVRQQRSV